MPEAPDQHRNTTPLTLGGEWEFRLHAATEPVDEELSRSGYVHPGWGLIHLPTREKIAGPWEAQLGAPPWVGCYRREIILPPDWVGPNLRIVFHGAQPDHFWWEGSARTHDELLRASKVQILVAFTLPNHPQYTSPLQTVTLQRVPMS